MIRTLRGEWSRVTCLRVIFFGLAFAAAIWILGEPFASNFYKSFRPLYTFFSEGYAIAAGICLAFLGGYKLAVRSL